MPEGTGNDRHKQAYITELQSCHIVVYLVDEPSDAVDKEIQTALRLGMPVIMLTHPKATADGDEKLTDYVKTLRQTSPIMIYQFDSIGGLESLVQSSIETVIASRFEFPRQPIWWSGETYVRAIEIVRGTNLHFALGQETSSLILGPHREWFAAEEDFLEEFYRTVARLNTEVELEIVHIFDAEATSRAWRDNGTQYPARAEWVSRLRQVLTSESTHRLHIQGVSPRISPFMVVDDTMILGHHIGPSTKRASIHSEVGELAMAMWKDARVATTTGGADLEAFLVSLPAT